jgi:hypothetical protein
MSHALYRDVLYGVFAFLPLGDFVRAARVRSTWRSAARQLKSRRESVRVNGADLTQLMHSSLRHHVVAVDVVPGYLSELIDVDAPEQPLRPAFRATLESIFTRFASNREGVTAMDVGELVAYFLSCGVHAERRHVSRIIAEYDRVAVDDYPFSAAMSVGGFCEFYRCACMNRLESVWSDISLHTDVDVCADSSVLLHLHASMPHIERVRVHLMRPRIIDDDDDDDRANILPKCTEMRVTVRAESVHVGDMWNGSVHIMQRIACCAALTRAHIDFLTYFAEAHVLPPCVFAPLLRVGRTLQDLTLVWSQRQLENGVGQPYAREHYDVLTALPMLHTLNLGPFSLASPELEWLTSGAVAKRQQLHDIGLGHTTLTDSTALLRLTPHLRVLDPAMFVMSDVSFIGLFAELRTLRCVMYGSADADLLADAVARLSKLRVLHLDYVTRLTDAQLTRALAGLHALEELRMVGLRGLRTAVWLNDTHRRTLKRVEMTHCDVDILDAWKTCTRLETLDLSYTLAVDEAATVASEDQRRAIWPSMRSFAC